MALACSAPEEARAQILRSAAQAVRGGRCPALVAPADRASASAPASPTTSTSCRWSSTTTSPRPATPPCSTSVVPFLKSPVLRPDQEEDYNLPERQRAGRDGVRALHARPGARLPARAARPAPDGHRRLERRHEPGRRPGQGRERLERLVLRHRAERVRGAGRAAGRRGAGGVVPGAGRGAAGGTGGERLGRRLVPPGLLRRRHAPGIGPERRVPDRRDPPGLGGDLRRRGPGASGSGHGRGRRATGARATTS